MSIVPAPPETKCDNVDHPQHYNNCSLECWDVMCLTFTKEELFAFCKVNAFKYLWRYKYKNGFEDIEKAKWYLNKVYELNLDNFDDAFYILENLVNNVIWDDKTEDEK